MKLRSLTLWLAIFFVNLFRSVLTAYDCQPNTALVTVVNEYRKKHGVPELTVDTEDNGLQNIINVQYNEQVPADGDITYVPPQPTGAGVTITKRTDGANFDLTAEEIVKDWYDEKDTSVYNYENPNEAEIQNFKKFATVVWKEASKIGCTECTHTDTDTNDKTILAACLYDKGPSTAPSKDDLKDNVLEPVPTTTIDYKETTTAASTTTASTTTVNGEQWNGGKIGSNEAVDSLHETTTLILRMVTVLLAISSIVLFIFGIFVGFAIFKKICNQRFR